MRLKYLNFWALFLLLVCVTAVARGQVAAAAREGSSMFTAGAGLTEVFVSDWGPGGKMMGVTAWVGVHPQMPRVLNGLSFEFEGQDAHFNRHNLPSNYRLDSISGGPVYTVSKYRNFQPYAKLLIGQGSMDFTIVGVPRYHHDTTTMYTPGGGFEYRVYQGLCVRVDYEAQFWPRLFHTNPKGLTIGMVYDGRASHRGE